MAIRIAGSSAFTRLLTAHALSQLGVGFQLAAFPLLISTLTTDPIVRRLGTRRTLSVTCVAFGMLLIPVGMINNVVVGAVSRLAYSALTPLGLAAGGFLAAWFGYPVVWVIAGSGFLAAFLVNLPMTRLGESAAHTSPRRSAVGTRRPAIEAAISST